ncbi:Arm DNA-binding domain-containing protein [Psychrobacillus sp. FSL W7-1457]|uniref:Arm DNA-binding domain-containing protein n=1 Tax=Psychrobacillus sp. FSL W7-1457 TaxID=2954547 RepID=UPI00315AC3A3
MTTTKRGFKTRKEAADELKNLQFLLATGKLDSSPQKAVKKSKSFAEIYDDWLVQYYATVQASTLEKQSELLENINYLAFENIK